MFERIANGWELTKSSWQCLRQDKELLVFPLVSGIACLMVLASFAVPLWFSDYKHVVFGDGDRLQDPIAWVILFAFYTVNYFVIVFFNSALVACALIRFRGGDPTVGDGLSASRQRLPQIFAWALASASVGVILKAIESRSEKLGQIAAGLLGAGWSIATYFVVPVLVVERVGPIDAVKRSFSILRKSWGETVVAKFGIGFFVFLATMAAMLPIVGGVVALASDHVPVGIALIAFGIISMILVSLISSALNSILLAALYLYAADGEVPQQFDRNLLEHAFGSKR